jgi:hypothetical protein
MQLRSFVLLTVFACRSSDSTAPGSASSASSTEKSNAASATATEAPAANDAPAAPPVVRSAAAIAEITRGLPLYPAAKPKIATTWAAPGEFAKDKWGSSYEADTADPMEKVIDWYAREMTTRGWTGAPSFKGMMSFSRKSTPGRSIVLASGPDKDVAGMTLIRVLVMDE